MHSQDRCDVLTLDSGVDYRMRNMVDLAPMQCFHTPHNEGVYRSNRYSLIYTHITSNTKAFDENI